MAAFKRIFPFVVITLAIAAAFLWRQAFKGNQGDAGLETGGQDRVNNEIPNGGGMPIENGAEEGDLPSYSGDPINNLGSDPFLASMPPEALKRFKEELDKYNTLLREDPRHIDGWIEVGVVKQALNNYIGARDAWEYAKLINPSHSTPYYNLGGLYGAYLKDVAKAEENYKKAIEIDPILPYLFLGFADFYANFYPEKAGQSVEVIKNGLEKSPNDDGLLRALKYYEAKFPESAKGNP